MNNQVLISELKRDEGLKFKPYKCTAGKLTIGIGRNLDDRGITEEEALYLLKNDIKSAEKDLDFHFPWWRNLPLDRQRALTNMVFNMGINSFRCFKKMIEHLQNHRFEEAAEEALKSRWAEQVGSRAYRVAALIRGDDVDL